MILIYDLRINTYLNFSNNFVLGIFRRYAATELTPLHGYHTIAAMRLLFFLFNGLNHQTGYRHTKHGRHIRCRAIDLCL